MIECHHCEQPLSRDTIRWIGGRMFCPRCEQPLRLNIWCAKHQDWHRDVPFDEADNCPCCGAYVCSSAAVEIGVEKGISP